MSALLNHHVDQISLVRLEEYREEQQASSLFAVDGHACGEHRQFLSDEQMSARIHQEFSVDLGRVIP